MWELFTHFAEVSEASGLSEATDADIFSSLGINWTLLLLQIISFVVLVIILAKFVYPPILAMLDRQDKKIENAMKAAEEAQQNANNAEAESAALLDKSRAEAAEIIETAKRESADIIIKAEEDASIRADAIIASAREDLDRDIEQARAEFRGEMVDLVALATEKVIDTKIDQVDKKLIKSVIEEAA